MKPSGSVIPRKMVISNGKGLKDIKRTSATRPTTPSGLSSTIPVSISSSLPELPRREGTEGPRVVPTDQSVEQKRLLIRKQLVILLHAIVCRRRDLIETNNNNGRDDDITPLPCNVPFCGLMKAVLGHLNGCKAGRTCAYNHCASSRQILIHWKHCVKADCPVCVSLRLVVPSSLLQIFPSNTLCRAELLRRMARHQQMEISSNGGHRSDQGVPELLESEE